MASRPGCHACGKEEDLMKRCSKCRKIVYCSRECQLKDWKNHKLRCSDQKDEENLDLQSSPLEVCIARLPVHEKDMVEIKLKWQQTKVTLGVDRASSGTEVMQLISRTSKVPMDRMKVIHRGRCLSPATVKDYLKPNAVFLVVGEAAEDEGGLVQGDVEVVMQQAGVDRNTAVRALRETKGDVIQAIIDIGNK